MGLRPGRAKGPWVGINGAGLLTGDETFLTFGDETATAPNSLQFRTSFGIAENAATPNQLTIGHGVADIHDLFTFSNSYYWDNNPLILSDDWIVTAGIGLVCVLATNPYNPYREEIYGDYDYIFHFQWDNGAVEGEKQGLRLDFTEGVPVNEELWYDYELKDLFLDVNGSTQESIHIDVENLWIRVTRIGGRNYYYYADYAYDTDASSYPIVWTLIASGNNDYYPARNGKATLSFFSHVNCIIDRVIIEDSKKIDLRTISAATSLVYGVQGNQLLLKGISGGSNISISNTAVNVVISAVGIVENGANVGTGAGTIFRDKIGNILNLKSINAGTNIAVTNNANDITIAASGLAATAANVGTGEGTIFRDKTGTTINLKSIKQGSNISVTNNADDITIAATASGVDTFIELTDTPGNYTGEVGGRTVRVNSGKTALEYVRAGVSFPFALTDAATIAVDLSKGDLFRVTLGATRILGNPTNPIDGQKWILEARTGAGGFKLTFDTKYRFCTDLPVPTLTGTASKMARYGFIYNSTDDKHDLIAFLQEF